MKKSLLALAAFAALASFGGSALAQSASYNLTNLGAINNSTTATATVNGAPGTSMSVAKGDAMAAANGQVSMQFGSQGGLTGALGTLSGDAKTSNTASAFNASTGAGVGAAGSQGWADSAVYGATTYNAPGQTLSLVGQADAGSIRNNPNGTDVNVQATTNQDGYATSTSHAGFGVTGHVASGPITGGVQVIGGVSDTKISEASAETGRITFTGTAPVGMSQAGVLFSHGASQASVSAAFADPAQ